MKQRKGIVEHHQKSRLSEPCFCWKARGRRGHSGSHVGIDCDWAFHTERRDGEAGKGMWNVSWCEVKFTFLVFCCCCCFFDFYFIQPPSNLGSEIKLIKFIKLVKYASSITSWRVWSIQWFNRHWVPMCQALSHIWEIWLWGSRWHSLFLQRLTGIQW